MGLATSKSAHCHGHHGCAPAQSSSRSSAWYAIKDAFNSIQDVQHALRREGLESSQLVVAIDFTKSNEWTGEKSFYGRCLHHLGPQLNPYQMAISIIAHTLSAFDDDGQIPVYGFGSSETGDRAVFSFKEGDQPCNGLEEVQTRYAEITPNVKLAGPTSFAAPIYQAMKQVVDSGGQYHILLLVADGQVTRSSDLPRGHHSPQEQATINAIVEASAYPLSIIMIGVGDGPFDMMKEFDDALPQRAFDNFQFVNFTAEMARFPNPNDAQRMEASFALNALMEIPEQFRAIQKAGLVGRAPRMRHNLPPPMPPPRPRAPMPPRPPAATAYSQAPDYPQKPGNSGFPSSATPSVNHFRISAPAAAAPPSYSGGSSASFGRNSAGNSSMRAVDDSLFLCPITQEIMTDPVLLADGYSYERAAVERWLSNHDTSPMTNARLPHKNLTPNHALRSAIMSA